MNNGSITTQYLTLGLGTILLPIQQILSLIFCLISVIVGVINLVAIIKKSLKDKKIDDSEREDIEEAVKLVGDNINEVIKNIDEMKKGNNNDEHSK